MFKEAKTRGEKVGGRSGGIGEVVSGAKNSVANW